jgi:hypothetical protein
VIHGELRGAPKISPWIEEWDMRLLMNREAKQCLYIVKHYREKFDDDDRDVLEYWLYVWADGIGFRLQPSGRKGFTESIDFDQFLINHKVPCVELAGYVSLPGGLPFSFSAAIGEVEKAFQKGRVRMLPDGFRFVTLSFAEQETETSVRFDPKNNMPVSVVSNGGRSFGRASFQFETKFEKIQNVLRPVTSTGIQPSFKVTRKTGELVHTEGHFNVDVVWHQFREESIELPAIDMFRGQGIDVWEKFIQGGKAE